MTTRKPPSAPVFEEPPLSGSFSEAALTPLFELNAFFLNVLIASASRPPDERPHWALAQRSEWTQLSLTARQQIARCPVCLVDAGFKEEERWEAIARRDAPASAAADGLPGWQAVELAHMTFTLAWTVARESLEGARIIFGMTPPCARIISSLSIHRIQGLAEQHHDAIRPAWEDHPEIWRHLLSLTEAAPAARLPPVHVRAMQRQLTGLALATGASQPTRQPHR
jgi:hypothetical protein